MNKKIYGRLNFIKIVPESTFDDMYLISIQKFYDFDNINIIAISEVNHCNKKYSGDILTSLLNILLNLIPPQPY
ncbi:hypothetical protein DKT75_20125 [Leucothrix arctica]|uniref:Uncharacterized protein n=1 Tax=Leucothrix arctica TaxID=1481894 RepID=A0A317CC13_9GAMM|nr:hypothetical protein DKT75_20125 [Leucothrix arctica]